MKEYLKFNLLLKKQIAPNVAFQLPRALSIQAEGRLLEKHAIAPSAARL